VFAQGGLYLVAFVPEYRSPDVRRAERLLSLSVSEDRFEPVEREQERSRIARRARGPPERIEIAFEPRSSRM
jgi:hypothetical protein